jgi:hypothetical protein
MELHGTDIDCRERCCARRHVRDMKEGQRFRSVTRCIAALALVMLVACARKKEPARPLVESLRCGMTREEVATAAQEHGFNKSFQSWLTRSAARPSSKSKELSLADLTFRNGRLVAVKQGSYDPRTKQITYRTIELCPSR